MSRRPPRSTPFPYPTLFRSERRAAREAETAKRAVEAVQDEASLVRELGIAGVSVDSVYDFVNDVVTPLQAVPVLLRHLRSEEHTSELQSPCNIVCLLLL